VDQEVAKTLGELELKLQELERELTTIGGHNKPAKPLRAPGKLVDEAVERDGGVSGAADADEQVLADGGRFGEPVMFGGEEVPAQPGATVERDWTAEMRETAYGEIPTPPSPLDPPGPPPTSPSPTPHEPPLPPNPSPPIPPPSPYPPSPPSPPPPAMERRSVELAKLVQFRDKLASTMDALIDEYSQLLSTDSPSHPRRDA
jgi:hypothetical protein